MFYTRTSSNNDGKYLFSVYVHCVVNARIGLICAIKNNGIHVICKHGIRARYSIIRVKVFYRGSFFIKLFYGKPEKGAIYRISKKDLSDHNYASVDCVAPVVAYTADYNAGLFIYGDYV